MDFTNYYSNNKSVGVMLFFEEVWNVRLNVSAENSNKYFIIVNRLAKVQLWLSGIGENF